MNGKMSMRRVLSAAVLTLFLFGMNGANLAADQDDIVVGEGYGGRAPKIEGIHGYAMHRVKVQNLSPDKTHRVTLRIPVYHYDQTDIDVRIESLSITEEIGPSTVKIAAMYQPALRMYGRYGNGSCEIEVNGVRHPHNVLLRNDSERHGNNLKPAPGAETTKPLGKSSSFKPRVLIGTSSVFDLNYLTRGLSKEFTSRDSSNGSKKSIPFPEIVYSDGFDRKYYYSFSEGKKYRKDNNFDPNWLNYSSFDGIVYAVDGLKEMTPEARLALLRYAECGGSAVLMAPLGAEDVSQLPADFDLQPTETDSQENAFKRYDVGFGVLFLVGMYDLSVEMDPPPSSGTLKRLGAWKYPDSADEAPRSWYNPAPAWHRLHTAKGANNVLPMAKTVDLRSTLLRLIPLMLLAAVLIGPVNLLILKRIKRRIWAYWTTPVLSALAVGILVLYAAVAFGWRQQTRVVSLTHLDQSSGRAATIGWTGYYSPLEDVKELAFHENTELTAMAFGGRMIGSIDWTDGQRLTGGWVSARIPRHFKLRKNEDRTERIDLEREGGALKIANRLGAGVKGFWYADHDGNVYTAVDVPDGGEAVLTKTEGAAIGLKTLREIYASENWVAEIEAAKASPAAHLQPGRYFAELEENVFLENAMQGAEMKSSTCLVVGELE